MKKYSAFIKYRLFFYSIVFLSVGIVTRTILFYGAGLLMLIYALAAKRKK